MCTLLQPVAGLYVGNLNALARTLCCKVGTLLMRYLGMPLGAHYKDSSIWYPIIEKAVWLETTLFGKRWQAYFVKKYSLKPSHLLFIFVYYVSGYGS